MKTISTNERLLHVKILEDGNLIEDKKFDSLKEYKEYINNFNNEQT